MQGIEPVGSSPLPPPARNAVRAGRALSVMGSLVGPNSSPSNSLLDKRVRSINGSAQ